MSKEGLTDLEQRMLARLENESRVTLSYEEMPLLTVFQVLVEKGLAESVEREDFKSEFRLRSPGPTSGEAMDEEAELGPAGGTVQITIPHVAGELLEDRVDTLLALLNDGESFDLTVLADGDIRDITLFYEDGEWRYEAKDYTGIR